MKKFKVGEIVWIIPLKKYSKIIHKQKMDNGVMLYLCKISIDIGYVFTIKEISKYEP